MTFRDLAKHTQEGVDFRIRTKKVGSPILIMAIHGGSIEPLTSEIATAIAGDEFDLYLFEGLRSKGNDLLHIDGNYFDEPQAQDMLTRAEVAISVHGHANTEQEFVMIGGLFGELIAAMEKYLMDIGIEVYPQDHPNDVRNICNRGLLGKGVELMISEKLRIALKDDEGLYRLFIHAIRRAIAISPSE